MNILQINASARRQDANSTRLANSVVARLQAAHPGAQVTVRDLAATSHPMLDEVAVGAMFTPVEQRTPEQCARMALNDVLIAELQACDILVLGVPMYNFGTPVQLKNWIDSVVRNGVTFSYTDKGLQGLLTGKKVYVACARGGRSSGTEADSQTPYLKTVLGFIGLSDVQFIYAEGLNMGPEAVAQGFAKAEADLNVALA